MTMNDPAFPRQDRAERGEKKSVSWSHMGPTDLAAQDIQLVTQDDDFETVEF